MSDSRAQPVSDAMNMYEALRQSAGVTALPRTYIELRGRDRASFLQNMCTNDVAKLAPGATCEAFLTNVQGKTLAHVFIHNEPEAVFLETVPDQGSTIVEHLDRYLIREDVQVVDRTEEFSSFWIAGPRLDVILSPFNVDRLPPLLGALRGDLDSTPFVARRTGLAGGDSVTVFVPREAAPQFQERCEQAGATRIDETVFDQRRIETGTPFFGIDITPENLPQEVNRNHQAINFQKGCYIGQETIARLDALGHVNKLLVGLQLCCESVPDPGTILAVAGKPVARITSACNSPVHQSPLALAYVRRGSFDDGTEIQGDNISARVVPLDGASSDG